MQAYLQYRSIRNAVRRQLDDLPDRARASLHDGMSRPEVTDGLDPSSSQTSSSLHSPRQEPVSHGFSSPLPGVELLEKSDDHGNHCEVFLVGWDHDEDPMNPRNFTVTTRVMATLIVSALAFVVSAASSIESAVLRQNSAAYNVSEVVASLATGIFLLGFAAGSLVSGPLSEILGRNIVYIGSTSLFMVFIMASGLAPNIGSQLAFRFLAGVFGCPPLTCAGGTVADLWDPLEKTLIFPLYAILSFGGAVLILIMAGLVLGLVVLCQPETYSPLLKWKAHHLRQLTGDPRYQSKLDLDRTSLLSRIVTACGRQSTLAMYEPIILLLALYMTILYIVLFTFFDGYTHIFSDVHDLSQGLTNIIWVAMYVGIMLAGLIVPGIYSSMKNALKEEIPSRDDNGNDNGASSNRQSPPTKSPSLNPENRLWYAMIGAPAIPISLFWMGWTDYKNISVWSPIVGSSLFGFGSICMFISSYMYVIDAYEIYAASALGFMTVTRYCAAGGMTVAGVPFYNIVGVQWTLMILGINSAVMVPVSYIFWKFGKVIRGWSRYAV
ncbi:major facilitator superfamily domain-containing protein [Aspergillus parasiticus]|uniref:Major facilitator superfamily domain-containing protein n=1 Tax=Aspergillus parasiticus TaxID=5067 RepID=A0A5N6D8B5_ASPPA|nr:major facilitator superfamily domain-containing protein [Aspergillus parasiticus]